MHCFLALLQSPFCLRSMVKQLQGLVGVPAQEGEDDRKFNSLLGPGL